MIELTPKERVFSSLRFVQEILESGENLESRRYEITRSIRNCISWESELTDKPSLDEPIGE
jgi:hypothetical protein